MLKKPYPLREEEDGQLAFDFEEDDKNEETV